MKIGFIGTGNMGGAILEGYSRTAGEKGHEILAYDSNREKLQELKQRCSVKIFKDATSLVKESDMVIVGVKPNRMGEVLSEITSVFSKDKVLISMAAGITLDAIADYLGKEARIVRIMPNTPARVGQAMTAVCRNANVDDNIYPEVLSIFSGIGRAEDVPEEQLHCIIGVSGSSPAYTYMYIQALMEAAVAEGMTEEKARIFAAQAVLGAAAMVLQSDKSPEQLRIDVCSPGGTTIEAVNALMGNGFMENVKEGFEAAVAKSREMSR